MAAEDSRSEDLDDDEKGSQFPGEEHMTSFASYRWPNGDVYAGFWKDGMMHGFGTLKWANGDSYEGNWAEGRIEGKGKKVKLETGVVEEGEYVDGVVNGVVNRVLLKSGDKFRGNDMDGYGEYTWATERYTYHGKWFNGKIHGIGKSFPVFSADSIINDRSIVEKLKATMEDNHPTHFQFLERNYDYPGWIKCYSGSHREGRRHGSGVGVLYDGSEYTGEWKDDLFHGHGRLIYASESSYKCENLTHPQTFFQEINLESLEELKRCSKVNLVFCGTFRAGRANGRGVMGQSVTRMPFDDGDIQGNRRGVEFLLAIDTNSQASFLNGLVAFDKELLETKLMEEDEDGDPPGSGGIHWSVLQLVSYYHGFVFEGIFEDGNPQGEGIMYNLFDRSFEVAVSRSEDRWKVRR